MHEGGEVDMRGSYCALAAAYITGILTPEARAHTHTRTRARARAHARTHARGGVSSHTQPAPASAQAQARARARSHKYTDTNTHAHTQTPTHTQPRQDSSGPTSPGSRRSAGLLIYKFKTKQTASNSIASIHPYLSSRTAGLSHANTHTAQEGLRGLHRPLPDLRRHAAPLPTLHPPPPPPSPPPNPLAFRPCPAPYSSPTPSSLSLFVSLLTSHPFSIICSQPPSLPPVLHPSPPCPLGSPSRPSSLSLLRLSPCLALCIKLSLKHAHSISIAHSAWLIPPFPHFAEGVGGLPVRRIARIMLDGIPRK